jgi:hypothetical protein
MGPITTTLVAALSKLAEPAVREGYEALKGVLKRKFGAGSDVVSAVEKLEQKPGSEGRRATLDEEVQASKASADADVAATAKALADLLVAGLKSPSQEVRQVVTGDQNIFSGTGDVTVRRERS